MTTYPNFDPSKSYIGECQVCGAYQVVNKGLMVLHGYKRPGDGFIMGRCWGEEHVPFELSCEVAVAYHKQLVDVTLPEDLTRLKILHDPALAVLDVLIPDGYHAAHGRTYRRETKYKIITIAPGYVHKKGAENDYIQGTTFEAFRKQAISKQKKRIEQVAAQRDYLATKIAAWKYAPEALKTRAQVKEEERQAAVERKAEKLFLGNWKRL
jgi:hypothetical protein